jgi:hypothetical protein
MKLNLGIESGSPRLELYPRDVLSACDLGTNLLKQAAYLASIHLHFCRIVISELQIGTVFTLL